MPGFKDYFNSTTMTGRANVAKATYGSIFIWYLWHRARKPKKGDPPPSPPKHKPFNECCDVKPEPKCDCERQKESQNDAPSSTSPPLDDGYRYGSDPSQGCGPSQGQNGHGDGNSVRQTKASALIPQQVPKPAEAQKPGIPVEPPSSPNTTPNQRKHISIWFD